MHYDVCRAKKIESLPSSELWLKDNNSLEGVKVIKFKKDFSYEGIEAFLEVFFLFKANIIESIFLGEFCCGEEN